MKFFNIDQKFWKKFSEDYSDQLKRFDHPFLDHAVDKMIFEDRKEEQIFKIFKSALQKYEVSGICPTPYGFDIYDGTDLKVKFIDEGGGGDDHEFSFGLLSTINPGGWKLEYNDENHLSATVRGDWEMNNFQAACYIISQL